ncbi:G2/M phase-specific E3 ubiquitin-protein ligase-like [Guaruba guarouba]
MEQACVLCRRAEADPDVCGPKGDYHGICAHRFCLRFASEMNPQATLQEGQMRFLPLDILSAVEQAAQMTCFVCGEMGASITCQEMGCYRRFHLPCAVKGGCVTRYLLPYSSFCWEHRPQQRELAAPEDTTCVICMEPVEDRTTYGTMVCPVCKCAWFHRACIQVGAVPSLQAWEALSSTRASLPLFLFFLQGQAMCAGYFCLQCPACRNTKLFVTEMFSLGIRIPSGL